MRISDWSSDVCSSDVRILGGGISDGDRVIELFGAQSLVGHRVVDRQEMTIVREVDRGADRLAHDAVAILENLAARIIRGDRGREDDERLQRIAFIIGHFGMIAVGREERSEEHTSELQSLMRITYAVLC